MTYRTAHLLATTATTLVASVLATAAHAGSAQPRYVIAVGYNGLPEGVSDPDGERLRALRFADDDAAEVYSLFMDGAVEGALLATLDAETQRKRPDLVAAARPPTRGELRQAVSRIAARMSADRDHGLSPEVVFFYSGHGTLTADGPALSLQGAAITSAVLYDQVIEPLAASRLHILIDACHAEAVVRPRDLQAAAVDLTPGQAETFLRETTLARYPNAGAIIATTRAAQSHEWETYGAGVFTHELLSALRGAADVNGDGRIEYSEAGAFLAAANRDVVDTRARLAAVVIPPRADARAPLIALDDLRHAGRLRGHPARLGNVFIEDERGVRLLDTHAERGFLVTLVVPAGQRLFVHSRQGEAQVVLRQGETLSLDALGFSSDGLAARGALESALRRGLFGTSFGPGYYLGYVDRTPDAVPVPAHDRPDDELDLRAVAPSATTSRRHQAAWLTFGAAAMLGAAGVAVGAAAAVSYRDVQSTSVRRTALEARDRYVERRNLALTLSAATALCGAVGLVLWHWRSAGDLALSADGGGLAVSGKIW